MKYSGAAQSSISHIATLLGRGSKNLPLYVTRNSSNMKRPAFDELPLNKGDPPFSAWGLYGPDDELGTLNLLTPEVVKEAGKEIQTGVRVGLNLPMEFITEPSHNRQRLVHKIIHKHPRAVFDDTIELNTQISTQWDGFRHYGYQDLKVFYNGATAEDFSGSTKLGMHAWCKKGIAGRGVLLDYLHWSQSQGKKYEPLSDHLITLEDLRACAKAQNVTLNHGDILLVRSGFTASYAALSEEAKVAWGRQTPTLWAGIEATVDMFRFLWDSGISACAGDSPSWERIPFSAPSGQPILHEVMLGGWAMPIGEFFDLEALSEECQKQGRYSFFFTSMPLNLAGGVGSPPNVMAIF